MTYIEGRERHLTAVKVGLAEPSVCVHVVPISNDDVDYTLVFAKRLRAVCVSCIVDTREGKMKKKLSFAADNLAFFVAIVGNDERANDTITLRDLDEGAQQTMQVADAITHLVATCQPQR